MCFRRIWSTRPFLVLYVPLFFPPQFSGLSFSFPLGCYCFPFFLSSPLFIAYALLWRCFIPPSPLYVSVRFGFLARFPESLIFELSVVNAVKVSSFSFFSGVVMEVDGVGWSSSDGLGGTEVLFHFSSRCFISTTLTADPGNC